MDIFVITKWTPSQLAWNASERSQLDLHWERHLRDLLETSQKRWLFCNVFRTSQIPVKKDGFFVTSLRHLKNILKRCLLCDVFKMSRAHLKKDIYSNIRAYLWGVSKTSRQVFVIFQRYPKKMVWCDFRRVITMSDKIQKSIFRNTQEMKRFLGAVQRYQSSLSWISVGWYISKSFGKSTIVKAQ